MYTDTIIKNIGRPSKQNLVVTHNSSNPTYQVDVNADYLQVLSRGLSNIDLTVDITASGLNGLDTGSEANSTWYAIWVINDPVNDLTAGLLSTSATTPTLPAGYTKSRLVSWVYNGSGGDFRKFFHVGGWYLWDTPVEVLAANPAASTWTDVDCSTGMAPGSRMALIQAQVTDNASACAIYVRYKGGSNTNSYLQTSATGATATIIGGTIMAICDSDRFIQYTTDTDDTATISIAGFSLDT